MLLEGRQITKTQDTTTKYTERRSCGVPRVAGAGIKQALLLLGRWVLNAQWVLRKRNVRIKRRTKEDMVLITELRSVLGGGCIGPRLLVAVKVRQCQFIGRGFNRGGWAQARHGSNKAIKPLLFRREGTNSLQLPCWLSEQLTRGDLHRQMHTAIWYNIQRIWGLASSQHCRCSWTNWDTEQ